MFDAVEHLVTQRWFVALYGKRMGNSPLYGNDFTDMSDAMAAASIAEEAYVAGKKAGAAEFREQFKALLDI